MNTCKMQCVRLQSFKLINGTRYSENQKRCRICDIQLICDGVFCPCCGCRTSIAARQRTKKAREMLKRIDM